MRNFRTFVNDPAGNDPAATDYLGATNINNFLGEAENMVSRSGQSLSTDDGTSDSNQLQMAESAFLHGVKSQGFVDSGSANTYEITPISGASGVKIPSDYANMDGATVWFTPTNASTTDSTLNIGQTSGTLLGAKKLLKNDGSAITTEIGTDGPIEIRYDASADSSNGAWLLQPWSGDTGISAASDAEEAAWTSRTVASTPGGIAYAFSDNSDQSSNGYQILPGGVILQWGSVSLPAEGGTITPVSVVFPLAFTSNVVISSSWTTSVSAANNHSTAQVYNKSLTGFDALNQWFGAGDNVACVMDWVAIGY